MSQHSAHDRRWSRLRARKLEVNPTCETTGCGAPAIEVHHRVPQSEWPGGRHIWSNLRSVCDTHHRAAHGQRAHGRAQPVRATDVVDPALTAATRRLERVEAQRSALHERLAGWRMIP